MIDCPCGGERWSRWWMIMVVDVGHRVVMVGYDGGSGSDSGGCSW